MSLCARVLIIIFSLMAYTACQAAGAADAIAEAKRSKDRSDRVFHFLTLSDNKQYTKIIEEFDSGEGLDDDFAILSTVAQAHEKLGHNSKAADFYCRSAVIAIVSQLPGRSNDEVMLGMASRLDPKNPCIEKSKKEISHIKSDAK